MIVERIWTGNAYRNFNYLIACPETGEALAIDPLDHEKCLSMAKVRGWQITQLLNTHEHSDHTGGNAAVVAATGAKVIAHYKAGSRISGVDRGVKAGDVIKVGKTVELECLDTPGHTQQIVGRRINENAGPGLCDWADVVWVGRGIRRRCRATRSVRHPVGPCSRARRQRGRGGRPGS